MIKLVIRSYCKPGFNETEFAPVKSKFFPLREDQLWEGICVLDKQSIFYFYLSPPFLEKGDKKNSVQECFLFEVYSLSLTFLNCTCNLKGNDTLQREVTLDKDVFACLEKRGCCKKERICSPLGSKYFNFYYRPLLRRRLVWQKAKGKSENFSPLLKWQILYQGYPVPLRIFADKVSKSGTLTFKKKRKKKKTKTFMQN